MVNIRRTFYHVVLACLAAVAAAPLRANTAYSFDTALVATDNPLSFGFQFQTLKPLAVYALGYYDDGADGFLTQHEVGIFDSNGVLLSATFLSSGTTVPLIGQFRYQDIAPLLLPSGELFTVAATSGGPDDPWGYGVAGDSITGFAADPAIQIANDAARFVYQSSLQNPQDQFGGYTIYAGPNFLFSAVPEPRTSFLSGIALAVLAIFYCYTRRGRRVA
jgi:hypothetical protein